jgi:hypothetical protein
MSAPQLVIPAKAGIFLFSIFKSDSRLRGNDCLRCAIGLGHTVTRRFNAAS